MKVAYRPATSKKNFIRNGKWAKKEPVSKSETGQESILFLFLLIEFGADNFTSRSLNQKIGCAIIKIINRNLNVWKEKEGK
jgi:hypothetical protein